MQQVGASASFRSVSSTRLEFNGQLAPHACTQQHAKAEAHPAPARASARGPSAWPGTATVHVSPLREEAKALGLRNLRVERLDPTDPYDVANAPKLDIDVFGTTRAGGEASPVLENPLD